MNFSFNIIRFIAFYTQIFIRNTSEQQIEDQQKFNCPEPTEKAEFDFQKNDAKDDVMNQYKMYLNTPILGTVEELNKLNTLVDNQELFESFKIVAANWHFNQLASELLEEAFKILDTTKRVENQVDKPLSNFKGIEDKSNSIFEEQILKQEHEKIEAKCEKMKGIEGTKRALCYHFHFSARIVSVVDKWTTDKRAWTEFKHKKRIYEVLEVLSLHSWEIVDWMDKICNLTEIYDRNAANLINSDREMNIVHAENVARMIMKSSLFRNFLCKDFDNLKANAKPRLEKLMGSVELMRLEEKFPEILRIELMSQSTILESYQKMLSIKFGVKNRDKMLLRKTAAMMIGILRENENHFKKLYSKNENLQRIFEAKMKMILENAYSDLHSPKSICIMIKFVNLTQSKIPLKQLETELRTWKMKNCETVEQQHQTINDYIDKELGKKYMEEILALLESDKKEQILQILAKNGAKTILIKDFGSKFIEELDEGGHLNEIFPSNGFQNNVTLWEHYEKAILTYGNSSILGVKNRISADLFVFLRWLHQHIFVDLKMQILWDKINKYFDMEYDSLFANDEDPVEMINFEQKFDQILIETEKFVTKKIVGKQPTKYMQELLGSKWKQKIDKIDEKKMLYLENWEQIFKVKALMRTLHTKEMIALIEQEYFRNKFNKVLLHHNERLEQFVDKEKFIEELEKINKIKLKNVQKIDDRVEKHNGCPHKSRTREELASIDKANNEVDEQLLTSFVDYLNLNDAEEVISKKEKQCLPLELDTLLWNYEYFIKSNEVSLNIKQTNTRILNGNLSAKRRKIRICKAYHTFEYTTNYVFDQSNMIKWRKETILYEGFIDDKELHSINFDKFHLWVNQRCENEEIVERLVDRLCSNHLKVREMNFIAFRHLLQNSQQFRAYFCNMLDDDVLTRPKDYEINNNGVKRSFIVSKVGAIKEKLPELIGASNLIMLEEQFPEVLEMGLILLHTRPTLYMHLLTYKSHSSKAKMWTSRSVIPIFVQNIHILMHEMKLSKDVDAELYDALNIKSHQILRDAFKFLAQRQFYGWMGQSLCLLVQFIKLLNNTFSLCTTAKDRINLETIRIWTPNCTTNEAQDKVYQQQNKNMALMHTEELKNNIKNNEELKAFIKDTRGAKARIKTLLDKEENLIKLLENCTDIRNPEVFTDKWLRNLYMDFLDNFEALDKETKLAHILALSYAVWVRWMDGEIAPENPHLPIGLRQIYEQIWKQQRSHFKDIYDDFYDDGIETLKFEFEIIREVFDKVKEFVESKRNEKNLEKLGLKIRDRNSQKQNFKSEKLFEEWEAIWTSPERSIHIRKTKCQCQSTECQETGNIFKLSEWVQSLHFNALMDLLEHKSMRDHLKNEINHRQGIVERWLLQFMGLEMTEKMMQLIKLNDEQFAVMLANKKEKKTEKKENSDEKKIYEEKYKNQQNEWEEWQKEEKIAKINNQIKKKPKKKQNSKSFWGKKGEKVVEIQKIIEKSSEELALTEQNLTELGDSEKSSGIENSDGPNSLGSSNFSEKIDLNSPTQNNDDDDDAIDEDSDLENVLENININDFLSGDFLMKKYKEFLEDQNELSLKMLDIGLILYEISNRFKAAEGMNMTILKFKNKNVELFYKENKQLDQIKQKWNEFLQNNFVKTNLGNLKRQNLEKSLQIMLKEIYFLSEGTNNETKICPINKKEEEKEIKKVKFQMHRNNLANAIASGIGKCSDIWAKLDDEKRKYLLISLFRMENKKKTNSNLVNQFQSHLKGWQKMLEQQRIDRFSTIQHRNYLLLNINLSNVETEKTVHTHSFIFPQFNQQLFYDQNEDGNHLNQILIENNYVKTEEATKALNVLKTIVSKWSRDARLLETGSFMLGANTSHSDVDVICIVPEKTTKLQEKSKFFGTFECDLALRNCEKGSLYCLLCQHDGVEFLQKLPFAYIPLIKMKFCGIEFDVLFVSIPSVDALPEEPMTRSDVMGMIRKLAIQSEPDEKMIKSLAGHLTNDYILTQLGKKKIQYFRKFLIILKFWATSNYIYDTIFGFFNGISLAIMATKVILFYPNASVPFLLDKFFLTFALWNWPIPVRLAEYVPNEFEKFSWTPKDEEDKKNASLLMPIITPGCLEQNGMYNMNKSTFNIIQNSMQEALLKVRQIQSSTENWTQLFPIKKFTKKYEHYAAICCIVGSSIHLEQFCGFVERRIRLQLLNFDNMTNEVSFSHIRTEMDGKFDCPNSILEHSKPKFRSLHKAWLVGIELKNKTQNNLCSSEAKNRLKNLLNTKLSEEFDQIILVDYLKGNYQPVVLVSKYVEKTEVEDAQLVNVQ